MDIERQLVFQDMVETSRHYFHYPKRKGDTAHENLSDEILQGQETDGDLISLAYPFFLSLEAVGSSTIPRKRGVPSTAI